MCAEDIGKETEAASGNIGGNEVLVGETGHNRQVVLFVEGFGIANDVFAQPAVELFGTDAGASFRVDEIPRRVVVGTVVPVLDPSGDFDGELLNGIVDQRRIGKHYICLGRTELFVYVIQRIGQINRYKGVLVGQYGVRAVFLIGFQYGRCRNGCADHGTSARPASTVFPIGPELRQGTGKRYLQLIADLVIYIRPKGMPVVVTSLYDAFLSEDASRQGKLRFLIASPYIQSSPFDGRALEYQVLPVVAFPEGIDFLLGEVRSQAVVRCLLVIQQGIFAGVHQIQLFPETLRAVAGFKINNGSSRISFFGSD